MGGRMKRQETGRGQREAKEGDQGMEMQEKECGGVRHARRERRR